MTKYLILNRNQYYWRPNRCGYGPIYDAGLYSEEEAKRIVRCRPEEDQLVSTDEALKHLTNIRDSAAKLINEIYND